MPIALEQFVKQLTDSGVLSPGKLENFVPPNAHPKDADELARELIKGNVLTKFQAQQVLAGKAKALFLGNYTIIDKIGAGGMGQVYKAEHRRMHRTVAVKMLPPSFTKNPAAVARFQREVEAAAKLDHPNIVAAYDADEANGAHFLVMQFIDGSDLSARVKKDGPLPIAKAVDCILQAARGLEFAHAEGIVHRDIKPANLLLDKKGVVKILDMGLARIDAHGGGAVQAELTGTGAIMGTVDYMAPEQALSTKNADARADIYSLGCSLYYLLVGKATYDGDTLTAKLLAHQAHPIPSLYDTNPEVPASLEAAFHKMVAKRVGDRYQAMSDVITDLEKVRASLPGGATNSSAAASELSDLSMAASSPRRSTTVEKPAATLKRAMPKQASRTNTKLLVGTAGGAVLLLILAAAFLLTRGGDEEALLPLKPSGTSLRTAELATEDSLASSRPSTMTKRQTVAPQPLVAPFDLQQAQDSQTAWARHLGTTVEQTNSIEMPLVLIPPGEFLMGSTPEEIAVAKKIADADHLSAEHLDRKLLTHELPQHRVTLTKPFYIGATEVTIGQFRKFVDTTKYVTQTEQFGFGNSPSPKLDASVSSDQRKVNWRAPGFEVVDEAPVCQITWNDAEAFCNWLSDHENLPRCYQPDATEGWILTAASSGYRLPTEAEWEYSCRAGTTTQFSFGDDPTLLDIYGWSLHNVNGAGMQRVGQKVANAFGLYDVHGNLSEMCHDKHDASYYEVSPAADPLGPEIGGRVARGGPWNRPAYHSRSAGRNYYPAIGRYNSLGFRVVRGAGKPLAKTKAPAAR